MGFYDLMGGLGGLGMWAGYLGMAVLWIAAGAVVLASVRKATRIPPQTPATPPERARDVLERRYAAGEIDAAEFQRKKLDLGGATGIDVPRTADSGLHLVTQTRPSRELADLDWGPRPVA